MEKRVLKTEWMRKVEFIAKSPLFDADYYRSRFMVGNEASDVDAAVHYLRYSEMDVRSPSADFDTWDYLSRYSDVLESGANPLLHYHVYGAEEGRTIRPVPDNPFHKIHRLDDFSSVTKAKKNRLKIALCFHIFYDDYIPFIKQRLLEFPFQFDLYISCASEDAKSEIEKELFETKHGVLDVRVVENRGRNIAPLLVEFGSIIANYDLVGHVHTKKSLYTGSEKKHWCNHLISGVLGSAAYCNAVIAAFASKKDLKMIASECYYDLPFWALHELSNGHHVRELGNKLNLRPQPEFLDYPVGGMFWARGSIFGRLAALDLGYDDFDAEAGQTDGTFHHAVERIMGVLAHEDGGVFLKYSPRHGCLFEDVDHWRILFEKQKKSDLVNALRQSPVVSFDLFDTLVYRDAAEVEEAKIRVSSILSDRDFGRHSSYREFRNAAELKARIALNWQGDVGLWAIAIEMSKEGPCRLNEALEWLQIEQDIDFGLLKPRNTLVEIFNELMAKGNRCIIVSDTYYGEEFVKELLIKCGISAPAALYISSHVGLRKDRGDIWPYVQGMENAAIMHVGDNMVSDVQNPISHGVDAIFVPKMVDKTMWLGVWNRLGMTPSSRNEAK